MVFARCLFRPPRKTSTPLVCAVSKRKLQLVQDKGKLKISNLSPEEEARALKLADIALHNPAASDPIALAGSRAKADHRRLIEEVQREAKTSSLQKNSSLQNVRRKNAFLSPGWRTKGAKLR
jgi:hypothetical protein